MKRLSYLLAILTLAAVLVVSILAANHAPEPTTDLRTPSVPQGTATSSASPAESDSAGASAPSLSFSPDGKVTRTPNPETCNHDFQYISFPEGPYVHLHCKICFNHCGVGIFSEHTYVNDVCTVCNAVLSEHVCEPAGAIYVSSAVKNGEHEIARECLCKKKIVILTVKHHEGKCVQECTGKASGPWIDLSDY